MGDADVIELPISARINTLFRVWHKRGEPEVTNEIVAAAVTAEGTPLTESTLSDLREGRLIGTDNATLAAIATYFRTATRYLTDRDVADVHDQLLLLERMRDVQVRSIHLRGQQTSVDPRAIIAALATNRTPGLHRDGSGS
ncbi:nucleoid-associated protein EspR [Rhodococcus sp. Br-6]|nr:nucleoid-associated protein EspR [Rhodococcus sp. Br-6]